MSLKSHFLRLVAAFTLVIGFTFGALAHELKAGPNGGALTDLGAIHLELLMKADKIDLIVTDAAGEPVDVSEAKANLIVLAGTKKQTIQLEPVADSTLGKEITLEANGPYTVVAIVTIPGQKPYQGRFKIPELLAFLKNTSWRQG